MSNTVSSSGSRRPRDERRAAGWPITFKILLCLLGAVITTGCGPEEESTGGSDRQTATAPAATAPPTPQDSPELPTPAAPKAPEPDTATPPGTLPAAEPTRQSTTPARPTGPGHYETSGTVTRIVDGDTVDVTGQGGQVVTVRVLGIDSPETKDPGEPVQCWGPEATSFAQNTLSDKHVSLFTDPSQDVRDRYGRLLAYVILPDGSNYSILAARAGAARSYVYSTPVSQHSGIVAAETEAQNSDAGLWGPPCNGATNAPTPEPTEAEPPPGNARLDPRFDTCQEAISNGYGPYRMGTDPEYDWYTDRDGDGIVCER